MRGQPFPLTPLPQAWGEVDLAAQVDRLCFAAPLRCGLGTVLTQLGDIYLHTGGAHSANRNATALFKLLVFPGRDHPRFMHGVTAHGLRGAGAALKGHLKALAALLADSTRVTGEARVVAAELHLAAELALMACHVGLAVLRHSDPPPASAGCSAQVPEAGPALLSVLPPVARTDLANRLLPLIDRVAEVIVFAHCFIKLKPFFLANTELGRAQPSRESRRRDGAAALYRVVHS
jgi:hypothetical protein